MHTIHNLNDAKYINADSAKYVNVNDGKYINAFKHSKRIKSSIVKCNITIYKYQ